MPKFLLELDLGKAAMRTGEDIAIALEKVAADPALSSHGEIWNRDAVRVLILDENGNTVGSWEVLAS